MNQFTRWTAAEGPIAPGTTIGRSDIFDSRNTFNGGELGLAARTNYCRWSLDLAGKLSFGNTHSVVSIDGATITTVPNGGSDTTPGGLLVNGANFGRHEEDKFSFIPELNATLNYQLASGLRLGVGYTFLYWTNVARAAEQVDVNVDPTVPVGSAQQFVIQAERPLGARTEPQPRIRFLSGPAESLGCHRLAWVPCPTLAWACSTFAALG